MERGVRGWVANPGFHLRRIGWPGQVGLLLAAVAAVLALPMADDLGRREAVLRAQARELAAASAARAAAGQAPGARAAVDPDAFPPDAAAQAFVLASHEAAARHDLRLNRSDMRTGSEAGGRLVRHRIQLPVAGRYVDLRAWLAELMNANPSLVLEDLDVRRPDVGQASVEAVVHLALLTRAP